MYPYRNPGPVRAVWIATSLFAAALILTPLLGFTARASRVSIPENGPIYSVLDPDLEELLGEADDEKIVDFLIYMEAEADLEALELPVDQVERKKAVVNELKEVAAGSQSRLIQQLERLVGTGDIISYRVLWIANAVQVTGRVSTIPGLSTEPGIERIVLDTPRLLLEDDNPTESAPPDDLTWGVEKVRARHVWDGLGIDGTGVTVAIMDSGVDWLHPALVENYRGYNGVANPVHLGNWFDVLEGTVEPFDPRGHGTHVAGTAVGKEGIGVAPGAQWIAVRVLDQNGSGTVGNIHAGFQWLLAPAGDPSLSPDIVNNSWGSPSNIPDFLPDVRALQTAGIIPLFAAGNSGPSEGTIHTPAGYPDTFSVGASDDIDSVAWFSSRGPSSISTDPKPALVAPGTYVLSAMPGGGYSYRDGTSMATPHVAGVFALMLSADDTLNETQITPILTATATVIDLPTPSNSSGWGRIDAFRALAGEVTAGRLKGQVLDDGQPLPNATILIKTPIGSLLDFSTDETGRYEIPIQPALYDVSVSEFGYDEFELRNVAVTADQITVLNIDLISKPGGTVYGTIDESVTGTPLQASIQVLDTPISTTSDEQGHYVISLTVGTYDLQVTSLGHHFRTAPVHIVSGKDVQQNFTLSPAPRTLLVDSGQWYYRSQASYYSAALENLEISYDLVSVRNPFEDAPTLDVLKDYEVVIWSSPTDSPSGISAGEAISGFLSLGGNLLISGQNVSQNEEQIHGSHSWWRHHIAAVHEGKITPPITVTGYATSVFSSTSSTLNGPGSAENQEAVDQVSIPLESFSRPAFLYQDGSTAGLLSGDCAPFEAVYLGFGLEAVTGTDNRTQIISNSLNYFTHPDIVVGARPNPIALNDIAVPGHRLTKTFEIANLSESLTDTFAVTIEGSSWPAHIMTPTLTLGSCRTGAVTFTVDIPSDLEPDSVEEFDITLSSTNDASYQLRIPARFKTPGRILLVDDDRWYDREQVYISALEANGYRHDYWEIGSTPVVRGSPPSYLLNEYDFVIWYTGYDWFEPITGDESESLISYLNQGGRLFLSSQEFLTSHPDNPLTTGYFGVQSFRDSVTPTLVLGNDSPAFLDVMTTPLHLDYGPYQNFSDGIIPFEDSKVSFWHDAGLAGGVVNTGDGWKTVFWGIPFETIPAESQVKSMNRIVGWLSGLGDSSIEIDKQVVPISEVTGSLRTFTITLRADEQLGSTGVWITNSIPAELAIEVGSLSGDAQYNQATREVTWNSQLVGGEEHVIHYQAEVELGTPSGTQIENIVEIYYDRHNLSFERNSPIWVGALDLSGSQFKSFPSLADAGAVITYQLELINTSEETGLASATFYIPGDLSLITETIAVSSGSAVPGGNSIIWDGLIEEYQAITITYAVSTPLSSRWLSIPSLIAVSDGNANLVLLDVFVDLAPNLSYLPIISRD
ncbi:MAG TPA: S8 family serine peptidase [candidate division Zixibacteria bacterium]|nr:S8 family serine peptidase [candidate division Zixibacteria bacterium]